VKEDRIMEMIIMSRNKKWSELTAREKAPFVIRGIVQFALLAAALADIHRRPAEEIRGSKWLWRAVALVNFMGIGPIAYFLFGRKRA
jgi:Phospholipase_D-nuclease N-terminal